VGGNSLGCSSIYCAESDKQKNTLMDTRDKSLGFPGWPGEN
jgi:hypothetical protein